jgi:hypothetical protein
LEENERSAVKLVTLDLGIYEMPTKILKRLSRLNIEDLIDLEIQPSSVRTSCHTWYNGRETGYSLDVRHLDHYLENMIIVWWNDRHNDKTKVTFCEGFIGVNPISVDTVTEHEPFWERIHTFKDGDIKGPVEHIKSLIRNHIRQIIVVNLILRA